MECLECQADGWGDDIHAHAHAPVKRESRWDSVEKVRAIGAMCVRVRVCLRPTCSGSEGCQVSVVKRNRRRRGWQSAQSCRGNQAGSKRRSTFGLYVHPSVIVQQGLLGFEGVRRVESVCMCVCVPVADGHVNHIVTQSVCLILGAVLVPGLD